MLQVKLIRNVKFFPLIDLGLCTYIHGICTYTVLHTYTSSDVIMSCYCRYERQLDYERQAALRMEEEKQQKRKLLVNPVYVVYMLLPIQ